MTDTPKPKRAPIGASIDGWQAFCAGKSLRDNPYKRFTLEWELWRNGFLYLKKRKPTEGYIKAVAEKYWARHK